MSGIRIVRDYPHPPAKVWRAVTDPALIPRWTSTGQGGRPEGFAATVGKFKPDFVFIDVEVEYEGAKAPVSRQYAQAFRAHLPHFPATIAPLGRADLHPGIDWKAWHDHGFSVAPQAYECESRQLTPASP